ncbi:MAG TPA: hypothetical protein PKH07_09105, partial [bacterium]|nr:hypothetical protein [bacterium]
MIKKRSVFVNELHRRWKIAVFLLVADALLSACIGVTLYVSKQDQASLMDTVTWFQFPYGLFLVTVLGVSAFERTEKDGAKFFLYHTPVSSTRVFWAKYVSGLLLTLVLIASIAAVFAALRKTDTTLSQNPGTWVLIVPVVWCLYTVGFLVSPLFETDIVAFGVALIQTALAMILAYTFWLKFPCLSPLIKGVNRWQFLFCPELLVVSGFLALGRLLFRHFGCLRVSFRRRRWTLLMLMLAAIALSFCNTFIDFHDLFYLMTTRTKVHAANEETQRSALLAMAEKVDRYREEIYGPSCYADYLAIFGDESMVSYPRQQQVSWCSQRYRLLSRNPETRQMSEAYFHLRSPWWDKLREALACGMMYRLCTDMYMSPEEPEVDLLLVCYCIEDLCRKALYDSSNELGIVSAYSLSLALELSSVIVTDNMAGFRSAYLARVVDTCADMLWRSPTPEWISEVTLSFEETHPRAAHIDPPAVDRFITLVRYHQWILDLNEEAKGIKGIYSPINHIRLHLLLSYLHAMQEGGSSSIPKWLSRLNENANDELWRTIPYQHESPYSMRLTTAPTLRRRVAELSTGSTLVDRDLTPFEPADFEELDAETVAALTTDYLFSQGFEHTGRRDISEIFTHFDLIRVALASRRFYDLNGM